MCVGGGGGVKPPRYISIVYYMQKGVGWVQIACKIAYVLNGRPLMTNAFASILWPSYEVLSYFHE